MQRQRDDDERRQRYLFAGLPFPGNNNSANVTVSAPGYMSQTQLLAFNNKQPRTINWNLVPLVTATSLRVAPATGTYGGNTSVLTATLTAGVNGVSGKSLSFALNGTGVGTATTNTSGVATLASPSTLSAINAGVYSAGVTASFAGDTNYTGQTASSSLTVSKAQLPSRPTTEPKPDGGAAFSGYTSTTSGLVSGAP